MHVLGVSCYYHDAAAALLHDGVVVAAAEEERFSRRKHDSRYPEHAIRFCLKRANIAAADLDYVVFYEKPLLRFERLILNTLSTFPRSSGVFREAMIQWFNEKLWIKSRLMTELGLPAEKVLFVEHHLSHAASAFFCSPFRDAAVLTVDGVGEWTTTTVGRATADWGDGGRNSIELLDELRFPHSLGLLYSAFTAYLGFEVNEGEYKVMGMAPYGEPTFVDRVNQTARLDSDGALELDMKYFEFDRSTNASYSRRFVELFGPPRSADHEFEVSDGGTHPHALGSSKRFADVAASIQAFTEESLLRLARYAHERTGRDQLCIAGGVALNSVANGRLMKESPFKDIFIQPAAGDSGGALGAALYAYHVVLGAPRAYVMEDAYLGESYSDAEAADFFAAKQIPFRTYDDDCKLIGYVAERLAQGKVVGWHQGRFEWGPRALGNRSILADPRRASMKDTVNRMIKFREPFRPFAPVLPESCASRYFEVPGAEQSLPLRFMLAVLPWRADAENIAPAVNHGGTGRLQTVREEWNPRYNNLITAFGRATGVPILMNTSFNLRGEPIVSSPAEAWSTFDHSGIDVLVTGSHVVEKN